MMTNVSLYSLHQTVKYNNIQTALNLCLIYTQQNPNDINKVGVYMIGNDSFFICTNIFANFINKKPNTINRSLRAHEIEKDRTNKKELNIFFSKYNMNHEIGHNWTKRKFKNNKKMQNNIVNKTIKEEESKSIENSKIYDIPDIFLYDDIFNDEDCNSIESSFDDFLWI